MDVFSLVFLPDASVSAREWFKPVPAADKPKPMPGVGAAGKFREGFRLAGQQLYIDGTARNGSVISSVYLDDRIVTSAVVAAGLDAPAEAEVLRVFLDSTLASPLIQNLTKGVQNPFGELLAATWRALAATVLIPLESRVATDHILKWHLGWTAAHLDTVRK